EAELTDAKERADAANQAKSRFLANVSHEIRTPLGAIRGFGELLAHGPLAEPERRQFLDAVLRNTRQLQRVIDDILDLTKVEAGRLELERLPFDLPEVLEEVARSLTPQARAKGVALVVDVGADVPGAVVGDAARLRQILLNVVGNAVKF